MAESRRSFLKKFGAAAVGTGCTLPLLGAAGRALEEGLRGGAVGGRQWGLVIDTTLPEEVLKKVYAACTWACHQGHNVPEIVDEQDRPVPEEEVKWIWTADYEDAFPDQASRCVEGYPYSPDPLKGKPVLVLCNHCTDPPCTKVCPTKATWKRRDSDGIVMMDMHRCIGCRYCIAACPYGARSFNWRDPRQKGTDPQDKVKYDKFLYFRKNGLPSDKLPADYPTRSKGVVEKCDFCAELVRDWQRRIAEQPERREQEPEPVPLCVQAAREVPGGQEVLCFGDLSDPASSVSRKLRRQHTVCRRFSLGTGPNVFYIV
jgi:Fe-S-cluster-containing dehydrogenase component